MRSIFNDESRHKSDCFCFVPWEIETRDQDSNVYKTWFVEVKVWTDFCSFFNDFCSGHLHNTWEAYSGDIKWLRPIIAVSHDWEFVLLLVDSEVLRLLMVDSKELLVFSSVADYQGNVGFIDDHEGRVDWEGSRMNVVLDLASKVEVLILVVQSDERSWFELDLDAREFLIVWVFFSELKCLINDLEFDSLGISVNVIKLRHVKGLWVVVEDELEFLKRPWESILFNDFLFLFSRQVERFGKWSVVQIGEHACWNESDLFEFLVLSDSQVAEKIVLNWNRRIESH